MESWAAAEARSVHLGDARLDRRYVQLLDRLAASPELSIPGACLGWSETKAVYRFVENDRIDPAAVLAPHHDASLERMRLCEDTVLLCLQDTSFCQYHSQAATADLGPHSHDYERGFFLHPLLATTTSGMPLGTLRAETWVRKYQAQGQEPASTETPSDSESARWIRMLEETDRIAAQLPEKTLVNVADRECDFFAFLAHPREHCDFLVRSKVNRQTETGVRLHERLRKGRVRGRVTMSIPKHGNRPARQVEASLRFARVQVQPPATLAKRQSPLDMTVVHLRERGQCDDEPMEWFLLTSVPCTTAAQAIQMTEWYAARWGIEVFFRTLKTGCGIEELQMDTRVRIERTVMLYMIIAWRVLFLVMAGRDAPHLSSAAFFDEQEWHAAYIIEHQRLPPTQPPPLKDTLWAIAKLGGFLARKCDGEPGAKSIWIGLQRIHDMSQGIMAMKEAMSCG